MKYKKSEIIILLSILLIFLLCCTTHKSVNNRPSKNSNKTTFGNCVRCHEKKTVLPKGHKDTEGAVLKDCAKCHKPKSNSLRGKIPLSHIHQLSNVSCGDCHIDTETPKPLTTKECMACHDSKEEIAERTGHLMINPHNSPHHGTDMDCNLCHHQHEDSENYCALCHDLGRIVP